MANIRTRFAPSPTGSLHIGNLRTIIFSFLVAKTQGGDFILRIEDTDQKREVKDAVEKLLEILDWLGIEFDEGPHLGGDFGPYVQSERLALYQKHAQSLVRNNHAYPCFCSPERLQKMREEQQARKEAPRYDQACREIDPEKTQKRIDNGEKHVIRQKMPKRAEVIARDELRGDIRFDSGELEDQVLLKSDGFPTYQLAVVVDDHMMEITHVTRSDEWLPSFPKNILLYKAFGWQAPKFIHFPVVLNKSGGKLSKRQGDVAVEDFKAAGYLPEALINFNALLGWHPKGDNEILSLGDIKKHFKYQDVGTSAAVFDTEKLDYFNGYYIRQKSNEELVVLVKPFLKAYWQEQGIRPSKEKQSNKYIQKVIATEQERLKKLSEIGEITEFFFKDSLDFSKELLIWKKMKAEEVVPNLEKVRELLEKIPESNWTNDSIEEGIVDYLKTKDLKIGNYLWPMRVALTGRKASPGPFEVAEVLGKKETLDRLVKAIAK